MFIVPKNVYSCYSLNITVITIFHRRKMDFFGGKYSQVLCSQAFVQCKVVFWIFFLLDYNLLLSFVFFMVTAVIFNFKSVLMRPYNWNATIVGQNEFWIWKLQLWDLRNSKTQDWTGKLLAEGKSKLQVAERIAICVTMQKFWPQQSLDYISKYYMMAPKTLDLTG